MITLFRCSREQCLDLYFLLFFHFNKIKNFNLVFCLTHVSTLFRLEIRVEYECICVHCVVC